LFVILFSSKIADYYYYYRQDDGQEYPGS
jgi:hypothetical protein